MKAGDMVKAKYANDNAGFGVVLAVDVKIPFRTGQTRIVVLDIKEEARDIIKTNVRVMWGSEKVTDSWHRAYKLVVISESR